jgi:glycosyltransferase involved in cell wall biosynthesis
MLVSVIIPAYQAQPTLARAVSSALGQSWRDIEVIVVADDEFDYRKLMIAADIQDERLRFISTGRIASGCHNARNIGLAAAQGEFIAHFDADDVFLPNRIRTLLPLAQANGAVADNPSVVADASGKELYRAFGENAPRQLDIATLLALSVPLFPLVAREHAQLRLDGIELGEDFVANARLIDRLGGLSCIGETHFEYHVVTGSLSHSDTSAGGFEKSYTGLIERLAHGDRLGLSAANAAIARDALVKKRDFNRAFAVARRNDPDLNFQEFAARAR